MDESTAEALIDIARAAARAAEDYEHDSDDRAVETYCVLRAKAQRLNAQHQWSSPEEFDTLIRTPAAQHSIDDLNLAYGPHRETDTSAPAKKLLYALCGWATGLALSREARRKT